MTRARSTNIRSLIDSVWERMIRAVVAQLRDADDDDDDEQRRPDADELARPAPMMSRMIGARMMRQDEGRQDEEEVRDAHQRRCPSCRRRSPTTMPMRAPTTTVMTVASRPIDHRDARPVDGQVEDVAARARRSRTECAADGGSSAAPVAVTAVWSGPTNSSGAMARTVKNDEDREPDDAVAAGAGTAGRTCAAPAPAAASARRGGSRPPGRAGVALMSAPADRDGRRRCRRRGWPGRR